METKISAFSNAFISTILFETMVAHIATCRRFPVLISYITVSGPHIALYSQVHSYGRDMKMEGSLYRD